MKKFAVMSDNKVVNIVVGENKEDVESVVGPVIEYTDENPAYIGGTYNFETELFEPPVIE